MLPSLVPRLSRSLSLELRGEGREERESLAHIVCTCANYLGYHTCMRYPRKYMEVSIISVYKNTEILKNVLENLWICQACCSLVPKPHLFSLQRKWVWCK